MLPSIQVFLTDFTAPPPALLLPVTAAPPMTASVPDGERSSRRFTSLCSADFAALRSNSAEALEEAAAEAAAAAKEEGGPFFAAVINHASSSFLSPLEAFRSAQPRVRRIIRGSGETLWILSDERNIMIL